MYEALEEMIKTLCKEWDRKLFDRIWDYAYENGFNVGTDFISLPKLEVTQSMSGFSIYATGMVVKYWHKEDGEKSGQKIAIIVCDVTECLAGNVNAWVQIFANTDDKVL